MTVKTGEIHMITKKWDGCRDPSGKGCKTFDGLQISDKWIKLPFFERIALPCMWAHYWMGHFTCKYSTRQYKRHFLQMKLRFVADWELWIWGKYFSCTFSSYFSGICVWFTPPLQCFAQRCGGLLLGGVQTKSSMFASKFLCYGQL